MSRFPTEDKSVSNEFILYVDDQPSHRALFQKAFRGSYPLLVASSGEEGLKIIKENQIFLVIADHNMPGMTGIDFLEKVQTQSPQAVRAILSAYLDESTIKENAHRVQIANHLTKPWKLDRMREFIETSFNSYQIQQKIALPEVLIPTTQEEISFKPGLSCQDFAQVTSLLSETMDRRGANRIFLNYVEPKMREFIPLMRKHIPEPFRKAQKFALEGNIPGFEAALWEYLHRGDSVLSLMPLLEAISRSIN